MRVTYRGPHDGVELPMLHQVVVKRGAAIEVDDELGARLIEQRVWDADPEDIAAWVGDDLDRAGRLLVAERDGAGRADVIAYLELLVAEHETAADLSGAGELETVPAGTVEEVLAWVGGDPARAARALEVELSGKNRASLIAALSPTALSTKESD